MTWIFLGFVIQVISTTSQHTRQKSDIDIQTLHDDQWRDVSDILDTPSRLSFSQVSRDFNTFSKVKIDNERLALIHQKCGVSLFHELTASPYALFSKSLVSNIPKPEKLVSDFIFDTEDFFELASSSEMVAKITMKTNCIKALSYNIKAIKTRLHSLKIYVYQASRNANPHKNVEMASISYFDALEALFKLHDYYDSIVVRSIHKSFDNSRFWAHRSESRLLRLLSSTNTTSITFDISLHSSFSFNELTRFSNAKELSLKHCPAEFLKFVPQMKNLKVLKLKRQTMMIQRSSLLEIAHMNTIRKIEIVADQALTVLGYKNNVNSLILYGFVNTETLETIDRKVNVIEGLSLSQIYGSPPFDILSSLISIKSSLKQFSVIIPQFRFSTWESVLKNFFLDNHVLKDIEIIADGGAGTYGFFDMSVIHELKNIRTFRYEGCFDRAKTIEPILAFIHRNDINEISLKSQWSMCTFKEVDFLYFFRKLVDLVLAKGTLRVLNVIFRVESKAMPVFVDQILEIINLMANVDLKLNGLDVSKYRENRKLNPQFAFKNQTYIEIGSE